MCLCGNFKLFFFPDVMNSNALRLNFENSTKEFEC